MIGKKYKNIKCRGGGHTKIYKNLTFFSMRLKRKKKKRFQKSLPHMITKIYEKCPNVRHNVIP